MTELFNSTGFEVDDRVFVVLDGQKYFGTVKKCDERLDRIKVLFSQEGNPERIDWFHKSFWSKQN